MAAAMLVMWRGVAWRGVADPGPASSFAGTAVGDASLGGYLTPGESTADRRWSRHDAYCAWNEGG